MHLQALPTTLQPSAADFANNFTATSTFTRRLTNITANVLLPNTTGNVLLPNTPTASATPTQYPCLHVCTMWHLKGCARSAEQLGTFKDCSFLPVLCRRSAFCCTMTA
jgi:hypothetical protein